MPWLWGSRLESETDRERTKLHKKRRGAARAAAGLLLPKYSMRKPVPWLGQASHLLSGKNSKGPMPVTLRSPPRISSPSFPALLCPPGEGLTSGDEGTQAHGLGLLAETGRRLRRSVGCGREGSWDSWSPHPLPSGLFGEAASRWVPLAVAHSSCGQRAAWLCPPPHPQARAGGGFWSASNLGYFLSLAGSLKPVYASGKGP